MRRFVLLVLAACSHPAPPVTPHNSVPTSEEPCAMPPDWHVDEMIHADSNMEAMPAPVRIRVLTWNQVVDDRPLYIDSAILWIEGAGPSYTVVHLYRHPKDKDDALWHKAMIYDREGFQASASYARPPTRADLDSFLAATDFPFTFDKDYRVLGSGMCPQEWQESFGQAPWHAYH